MSEQYTLPEGFPQPTVYAKLMNLALANPLEGWEQDITIKVSRVLETFEKAGLEYLREAYAAGVADGYRQALVELEKNGL